MDKITKFIGAGKILDQNTVEISSESSVEKIKAVMKCIVMLICVNVIGNIIYAY